VVVYLPLEGAPSVRLVVAGESDRERLIDWIFSQSRLGQIVHDAEEASRAWARGELPRRCA
jgi:hypothetical protein